MSAEQHWKDKFLQQIDAQELAEQRWRQQADLLRRALVCSSLAAEGVDPTIDDYMGQLRELLRQEDFSGALSALLPKVERALLQHESRRQERLETVAGLLKKLAGHLKALPLPADTAKALRSFEKTLKKTSPQSNVLAALLNELATVQGMAINSLGLEPPKQGILARWFSLGSERSEQQAQTLPNNTASPVNLEAAAPAPANAELESHDLAVEPLVNAVISESEMAQRTSDEPVYSHIAEHVQSTLVRFLAELKAPDDFADKVKALQDRITAGLNLYELVAVLDELACLVLEVTGNGAQAFEGYLLKLNERLTSFQSSLEHAGVGYAASVSAARELDQAVNLQVNDLQSCINQAESLELLQQSVDQRLDAMRQTMARYQQSVDEQELKIGQHLEDLTLRVSKMEQEAKSFQVHIEQQRQLALLDSLTGLPNRLAWRERVESELARWQRHGGDLCLAVLDVDLFKRINDQFGHLAGDKVLKIIAHELRKRLRKSDFLARYGGEEFVLMMPVTSPDAAYGVLEALRQGVEACPFHFKGERVTITLSAGVAKFTQGDTAEKVFERADQALYQAKDRGRNQVVVG